MRWSAISGWATVHRLSLSVGAIVGACHRVAAAGQGTLLQSQDAIRSSPVWHLDQTSWRERGVLPNCG
jgi:hypothetical protein